jgi:uncharacterized membrane protein required for colicin V production
MNALDLVIIAAIGLGALFGSGRGVLRIASSLIALVAAVYTAARYSQPLGVYLSHALSLQPGAGAILGYVVIFLAVMIVVAWGGGKLAMLVRALHMSWADRLGGALVGGALGTVLAGLIVVIATGTLPADAATIRHSQLAPRVLNFTHDLAGLVPAQIRDAYYYRESQLITYWNEHKIASPESASGPAATP